VERCVLLLDGVDASVVGVAGETDTMVGLVVDAMLCYAPSNADVGVGEAVHAV